MHIKSLLRALISTKPQNLQAPCTAQSEYQLWIIQLHKGSWFWQESSITGPSTAVWLWGLADETLLCPNVLQRLLEAVSNCIVMGVG